MSRWLIIFNQYQPNETRYEIMASTCDEAIKAAMMQANITKRPANISVQVQVKEG
jgi:hypothetical protein